MQLKYIMVTEHGLELPILFPKILQHKDVAAGRPVVSAGFVSLSPTEDGMEISVQCYGESVGLKIKSRKEDSAEVKRALEFNC